MTHQMFVFQNSRNAQLIIDFNSAHVKQDEVIFTLISSGIAPSRRLNQLRTSPRFLTRAALPKP
jgi:hypothetical protein